MASKSAWVLIEVMGMTKCPEPQHPWPAAYLSCQKDSLGQVMLTPLLVDQAPILCFLMGKRAWQRSVS